MGKKKRPIKGLESKGTRNGDCYFIFKYPGKVSLIRWHLRDIWRKWGTNYVSNYVRAPRASGFEGQGRLSAEAPQNWGRQIIHSWRVHTRSHAHQDPGQKQWLHRSLGQTYLWVLEGLLGRQGWAMVHCGDKKTRGRGTREYSSVWVLLGVAIWH